MTADPREAADGLFMAIRETLLDFGYDFPPDQPSRLAYAIIERLPATEPSAGVTSEADRCHSCGQFVGRGHFAGCLATPSTSTATPTPDVATEDAEPPTLQAAIDRFYQLIDGPEPHDYEVVVPVGILRKAARAIWQRGTENGALATTPSVSDEGLDVERLARALHDSGGLHTAGHYIVTDPDSCDLSMEREHAEQIAPAYRALSTSPATTGDSESSEPVR